MTRSGGGVGDRGLGGRGGIQIVEQVMSDCVLGGEDGEGRMVGK